MMRAPHRFTLVALLAMQLRALVSVIVAMTLMVMRSIGATTTTNLLLNPGAEDGLTNWVSNGAPFADTGSWNPGINPYEGTYDFAGGYGGYNWLVQTVSLSNLTTITADSIDAGRVNADVNFWARSGFMDGARVTLTFYDDGGTNVLGAFSTAEVVPETAWANVTNTFAVPPGSRSVDYKMEFIRHAGGDCDAYTDANSLTLTRAPEPDMDEDGMPDDWETQYYGGSTNAVPNAMASNGANTVLEAYIAGLNPTSAASVFSISAIAQEPFGFVISWPKVADRFYSVWWSTNLLPASWSCIASYLQTNVYVDGEHDGQPRGFYRVTVGK